MLNLKVTNYPGGVGTASDDSVFRSLPMPGPDVQWNKEDFDSYNSRDSLLSQLPIGASGFVSHLTAANGVLSILTVAGVGNGVSFQFASGGSAVDTVAFTLEVWLAVRFRIDDPTQFSLFVGHLPNDSGITTVNGVYLRSVNGTSDLEIVSQRAGVERALVLGTIEANTWYDAIYYWDNVDTIKAQFFGPGKILAGAGGIIPGATLPLVGTEPVFNFASGSAAQRTVDWDYLFFAAGRE